MSPTHELDQLLLQGHIQDSKVHQKWELNTCVVTDKTNVTKSKELIAFKKKKSI